MLTGNETIVPGHYETYNGMTVAIVAMTTNAFAEDVQKSIDAGMNAHISKPVDANSLNKIIGDLMRSMKR